MKPTAITMREATPADAPEIMRHRRLMFHDMGFTDEAALDAMHATSEPYILAGLKDDSYRAWLAVAADGRVMGGGGVVVHAWLTHPLNLNPQRAYVLNVYVYTEFRRQGVARRLMEVIVEWCRDRGFPVVWLHASDEGRPLYTSMGFVSTNEMRLTLKRKQDPGETA